MSSLSILSLIVAGLIAAMTMAVSLRVLKTCPILSNPVISLCVGVLTFMGLISLPDGWAGGLLLPYAALGLTLLLLLLIGPFLKGKEDRRKKEIVLPEHDYSSREEEKKEPRENESSHARQGEINQDD